MGEIKGWIWSLLSKWAKIVKRKHKTFHQNHFDNQIQLASTFLKKKVSLRHLSTFLKAIPSSQIAKLDLKDI